MPDQPQAKRPHFILRDTSRAVGFKARSVPVPEKAVPAQPRQQHGASLQRQIEALKPKAVEAARVQKDLQLASGLGLQIQFSSQPNVALAFESLANANKQIELLNVRTEGSRTFASVFVPDGKLAHFEQYIADYLAEKKGSKGQALDHRKLLDAIESIRAAEISALWTDPPELLPADPAQPFWWEVWLPVRQEGQRQVVVEDFKKLARLAQCVVPERQVNFPERTVLLMHGAQQQLARSVMALNCVAELRRAKETAEFFDGMAVEEQRQWADDLVRRVQLPPVNDDAPRVCLLDSGVNRAHPLLDPLITTADLHTVEPAWGLDDQANHGTGLAGLAAYGDLTDALASADGIAIPHRLESVKLVPGEGANAGDARHHAWLFMEGVARPEISAPDRARVFSSAVTATDYRDRGRPSSWSAAVDGLAAGMDGEGETPRLFILSAGNTRDPNAWGTYPECLSTNLVHDPGQAWNAITVGACTDKLGTEGHPSLAPIASAGGLSPFTTTTQTWERAWPLKPDVVLEGGNVAKDQFGAVGMASLNLLVPHHQPLERLFTTSNATSAASALCAGMAARIMAAYPKLRPETIRALLVHSAQWSDAMRAMFLPTPPNKDHYVHMIRHCGWGTPDLNRALWSASDSLTLVLEDLVHPYQKVPGKVVTRDMNLHALPWPKEELEALQDTPVEMRVTLSYFIEPNPSARGIASKYHYPSHRLRFDVQRPLDASTEQFITRLNAAAQREDDGDGDPVNPTDPNWLLGSHRRHRGSLHQDIWKGTAAELASRGFIAVYPAAGWWRTRAALERYDLPARYSLVVSIQTPRTDVDLYAAVAQKVPVANPVAVGT
ncbi:S8 family peptidase [Delftia lacustris]|uniref:S8 family peptidase n=1 Tax=Delftia lacustris TaxID=558537 RepID=UPI00193C0F61|nr:S8 family peptidase [Delftia lacustris]QRI93011.1 S8 family peptidase [Delftia lacustris]